MTLAGRVVCTLIIALAVFAAPWAIDLPSPGAPSTGVALAQSEGGSGTLLGNRERALPESAGWWTQIAAYIRDKQQEFYRALAGAVRDLRETGSLKAAWALATISFLYGIFHAAGPGHGKAVISAYLLADERLVRRGVALAFAASVIQALSAIVLVSGALLLVSAASRTSRSLVPHLETASYGLVLLIGLYMLWAAIRSHHHDHHHHHDHGHDHGHGHAHVPMPDQVAGVTSLRKAASIAFAVGIRPCSGAVLVLIFAYSLGLFIAGIGATFAMALGTAITVSGIAIMTLYAKQLATALAGGQGIWLGRAYRAFAILGALAITLLGAMLLYGSLTTSRPLI